MLKQRVLTAIVLIALVVAGVWLPPLFFRGVSAIFFAFGLWEWTSLAGFRTFLGRTLCFLGTPLLGLLLLILFRWGGQTLLIEGLPRFILAFWVLAFFVLIRFPKDSALLRSKITGVFVGCMVLLPAWAMLIALQNESPRWVLYVLALVAVADSGAYFVGKRLGRHKLAPAISPGKTWEGVAGALVFSLVIIMGGYVILEPLMPLYKWLALGVVTVIGSIVGDLFESVFKRLRGVKDSGRLLPGHGGILDRIDGLTAAFPIFTIFLFY
jgi:phosphatidate cytidylyltransferase